MARTKGHDAKRGEFTCKAQGKMKGYVSVSAKYKRALKTIASKTRRRAEAKSLRDPGA